MFIEAGRRLPYNLYLDKTEMVSPRKCHVGIRMRCIMSGSVDHVRLDSSAGFQSKTELNCFHDILTDATLLSLLQADVPLPGTPQYPPK